MLKSATTTSTASATSNPSGNLSSGSQYLGQRLPMPSSQAAKVLGLFGRLTWMMLGPMALALVTFALFSKGSSSGWFTAWDITYFAVLGTILLGRCLEFRGGNPQMADGQPATRAHLRRYVVVTTAVGVLVWVVVNLLENLWLAR